MSSPTPSASPPTSGAAVQRAVETALEQRLVLVNDLARSTVTGHDDVAAAVVASLDGKGDGLAGTVRALVGPTTAKPLEDALSGNTRVASQYARALASHGSSEAASARAELRQQGSRLATALAVATRGHVPERATRAGFEAYVQTVVDQADAYARHDYRHAYEIAAAGDQATERLALAIAPGLAQAAHVSGPLTSPELDLEFQLRALLDAHVVLISEVLRTGSGGWPDVSAAASGLNANTRALGRAIDASLGPRASTRFVGLWGAHIDAAVQYARATAMGDSSHKRRALGDLRASAGALADAVSRATNGVAAVGPVNSLMQSHDDRLVQQIEDYAAHNTSGAIDEFNHDYVQLPELATALSRGIISVAAVRSPRGAAQTGGGAMSPQVRRW